MKRSPGGRHDFTVMPEPALTGMTGRPLQGVARDTKTLSGNGDYTTQAQEQAKVT